MGQDVPQHWWVLGSKQHLLTAAVELLTLNPQRACFWSGKDLTMIYNQPYADVGHRNPSAKMLTVASPRPSTGFRTL